MDQKEKGLEIEPEIDIEKVLRLFMSIWGIGRVDALKLYDLGCRSLEDLIRKDAILTPNQLLCLRYHQDLSLKISRNKVEIFVESLRKASLSYGNPNLEIICAGSYRRKQEFCGDIDCIVYCPQNNDINLVDVVAHFFDSQLLKYTLTAGQNKFMGLCMIDDRMCRIDFYKSTKAKLAYSLLTFTGNREFNIAIRALAKNRGYKLSQNGLMVDDKVVHLPGILVEEDIFKHLGVEYIPPEERSNKHYLTLEHHGSLREHS